MTRPARPAPPPVGRFASSLVADLARRTRFVDPVVVERWSEIAGPELSRLARPGRLTGGVGGRTLELVVADGAAAARVEFEREALIGRLARYFGEGSISRIAVIVAGRQRPSTGFAGFSRFTKR